MTEARFHTGDGPLTLHCIGVQFRDVPVAVRDAVALSPAGVSEALASIALTMPSAEAVVLATCNRTELYVVEAGDPLRLDAWHRGVGSCFESVTGCPADAAHRFHLTGADAARHLFRVTCGLESALVGDGEIGGQVRRARDIAVDAGTVGPVLHRLFDQASSVSRRARTETLIGVGGAGVGLATANAVAERHPERPAVTIIGAGEAATAISRELTKRLDARLHIVNRSPDRAAELAARHGARASGLDDLVRSLVGAEVIVTAVHADAAIIDADLVAEVRALDADWAPFVVDTCVPPMVTDDSGLDVVHLDELTTRERELHRIRYAAVPAVEDIIGEAVERFGSWLHDRALREVIAELFREAEAVTAEAAGLVDDDRVAREIHRAVRRLVHDHITRLRAVDHTSTQTWKELP